MKRMISVMSLAWATSLGAVALPAVAEVNIHVVVPIAPPPLRVEVIPDHRDGHVWVPGFWGWDGHQHVWRAGHWDRVRAGYDYVRPRWEQQGEYWRFHDGGWRPHPNRAHKTRRKSNPAFPNGRHCPPGQAKKGRC